MRISKVSYRELKSGPGFSHRAIEMEASLEDYDVPSKVLDILRERVRKELEVGEDESANAGGHGLVDPIPFLPDDHPLLPIDAVHHEYVQREVRTKMVGERAAIGREIERLLDLHVSQIGGAMVGLRELADDLVGQVDG